MLHSRNEAGRGLFDKELANMVYERTVVTKRIVPYIDKEHDLLVRFGTPFC